MLVLWLSEGHAAGPGRGARGLLAAELRIRWRRRRVVGRRSPSIVVNDDAGSEQRCRVAPIADSRPISAAASNEFGLFFFLPQIGNRKNRP